MMQIRLVTINDAQAISEFYLLNNEHLARWEPLRPNNYHSIDAWEKRLKQWEAEQKAQQAFYFISFLEDQQEIIATCSLTNIIKGPFQACNLGYGIAKKISRKRVNENVMSTSY